MYIYMYIYIRGRSRIFCKGEVTTLWRVRENELIRVSGSCVPSRVQG